MSNTDVVSVGLGGSGSGPGWAVEFRKHAAYESTVDRTDHGMFNNRVTKRTMFGDDLEIVGVGVVGSCRESVGRKRVGHRM